MADLQERIDDGMYVMGEQLVSLCIQATSAPSPPTSRPGSPPGRVTGKGQRDIGLDLDGSLAGTRLRVGYSKDANYMGMHESGIPYKRVGMQKRPSLAPTVKANKTTLIEVLLSAGEDK